jgi:POT family proton-dependent oligopeptide transporter
MENKDKMPKGIPYIIGNELAERFSFYGMKTILVIFMTKYLMDSAGNLAPMTEAESKVWYHTFLTGNYFFPILGALLADIFWGKYKTIILLSIVYCCGHLALAMDETRLGLSLGLTMIALGSGGIKPCVSAHVGDQFTSSNQHLLGKVYNLFYLSINLGSMVSILLTPYLMKQYGPSVAFGVPGLLMMVATLVFWVGRNAYTSVPATGFAAYKLEWQKPEVQKSLMGLLVVYLFYAVFWSLYDQHASAWVLQANSPLMDKHVDLTFGVFDFDWLKFELLPDQLQAINPILVLIFVPLFSFTLYPFLTKKFNITPLGKVTIGMFLTALSFVIVAMAENLIQHKVEVSILWQAFAFFILTAAEVMVYGTGLEFSYAQAPTSMKSLVMGMYMLSISMGNLITALVNQFIQNADGTSKLEGASYYWFFVWFMVITAIGFIFIAKNYKGKSYVQEG